MDSGNKPHLMAVAASAQGHVKPLMSLCRQIAKHGIKVTFVNAQSIHDKLVFVAKTCPQGAVEDDGVVLTPIFDGVSSDDVRNNPFAMVKTLERTMPQTLPDLIERINGSNPKERISFVIADVMFGWVLDIAERMGIEPIGFSALSVATLAMQLHLPKLVEQGYIDTNGSLDKIDAVELSNEIPSWRKDELFWSYPDNQNIQTVFFECVKSSQAATKAKWLLCNSCEELDPVACELNPKFLPVGPLHLMETKSNKSCSDSSNFYQEDMSCLMWLDTQLPASVIYVSFGSLAIYSQQQLDELALGLELSGRAFLWVVRQNLANGSQVVFPNGFLERVGKLGKFVEWAPQNDVLSHPAIACFVSHCGWNSTLEGMSKGVPYLCWPYFADQWHNESYICDKWEIGLRICCDENGTRSRYEIKKKIEMLLSQKKLKENVVKLKEVCAKSVGEGGSSYNNLEKFIDHVKSIGT